MKILLCDETPNYNGGAETYFNRLVHLLQQKQITVKEHLFTSNEAQQFYDFIKAVKLFKPQIIHFNKLVKLTEGQHNELKSLNIPVVLTVHDLFRIPLENKIKNKIKRIRSYYRLDYDAYIIPSKIVYEKLKRDNIKKIHFVPQFINVNQWKKKTNNTNNNKLLYVGRLEKDKGVLLLIKAFKNLSTKNTKLTLDIVGEGSQFKTINKAIIKHKLTKKIRLYGYKNIQEINSFYTNAYLLIFPTIRGELFGLVGIEAQACKLPVIASDLTVVQEWCEDKKTGLLFKKNNTKDLESKISTLLNDSNFYQQLQLDAHEFVANKFTEKKALNYLLQVYTNTLKQYHCF